MEQETENKPEEKRTWKLTVAAAFMLIALLLSGESQAFLIEVGVPRVLALFILVILPANASWGAYTRKMRYWTVVGALCSVFSMPWFGIPALILVIHSWHEFRPRVRPSDV